jgi:hypothetical protein
MDLNRALRSHESTFEARAIKVILVVLIVTAVLAALSLLASALPVYTMPGGEL